MSTNKTQNYQLHSWVPQDEFHVAEINENFTKLDAGAVRLLTGTYQGNNSSSSTGSQRIELGVKPKAVIVMSSRGMADYDGYIYGCIATQTYNVQGALTLDDSGFTVINSQNISSRLNISGYTYCYWVLY